MWLLFRRVVLHPELEAFINSLGITASGYRPTDLRSGDEKVEPYLNQLNSELLTHLQESGEMYVSNAVIRGTFVLRACVA
jgi:aromatic-L-amino-acid/L-tryptophan decarboxylase